MFFFANLKSRFLFTMVGKQPPSTSNDFPLSEKFNMAASNFAREQLEKHGWKEGSGLGRHEHGRPDPIKVKLKMDTAGVGHNISDQFTFNWWEHAFNKAASNITVESSEAGVSVKKTTDQELKLSTSESVMTGKFDNKAMLYGSFIKGATLTNGVQDEKEDDSQSEDSSDEEDKDSKVSKLTDEELFKACGGRTAHKAARHGHKLNGKLQRIQEQERELLKKYLAKKESRTAYQEEDNSSSSSSLSTNQSDSNINAESSSREFEEVKDRGEKKKKKRKDREISDDDKKLKKKKRHNKEEEMMELQNNELCNENNTEECEDSDIKTSKKKKKRKIKNEESDAVIVVNETESKKVTKKNKKKKKEKEIF
ncbi:G patch domain-containing protein 4-like [Branchiostoma floridae x Branchiostoma belcheri]